MRGVKLAPALTALTLAAAFASVAKATPPVTLETHLLLKIEALTVEHDRSTTSAKAPETEIGLSRPQPVELVVPWGPDGDTLGIHVNASLVSMSPDGDAVLRIESGVSRPGRPRVAATRELRLAEEGSGLFEVYGDGGRRVLLTIQAERVTRAVVSPPAEVGAPVRFLVDVLRVDGERVVLLETNDLHTFVGQSVEYSFHRGQGDGQESVRLSLMPVTVAGDIVTIDAEIDGTLPGPEGAVLLSRHERIVASRQAISRLNATTGTTPAGYRFQVTPEF